MACPYNFRFLDSVLKIVIIAIEKIKSPLDALNLKERSEE